MAPDSNTWLDQGLCLSSNLRCELQHRLPPPVSIEILVVQESYQLHHTAHSRGSCKMAFASKSRCSEQEEGGFVRGVQRSVILR